VGEVLTAKFRLIKKDLFEDFLINDKKFWLKYSILKYIGIFNLNLRKLDIISKKDSSKNKILLCSNLKLNL